jgi:hypothetical protein
MVNKFNDILKDLKTRTSNPLISSFIISWFIINWKIIIVLLLYEINDLEVDGYTSFLDYINKNRKIENVFWYPLVSALFYTFTFPFIRNCIIAFNAWIKSWGTSWFLEISKVGKISMDQYIDLRKKYFEKENNLQDLIENQAEFLKKRQIIQDENQKLKQELNDMQKDYSDFQNICTMSSIVGYWKLNMEVFQNHFSTINVDINHDSIVEHNNENVQNKLFKIMGYFIDITNNEIILSIINSKKERHYLTLKYNKDFTNLEGELNSKKLEFKRQ